MELQNEKDDQKPTVGEPREPVTQASDEVAEPASRRPETTRPFRQSTISNGKFKSTATDTILTNTYGDQIQELQRSLISSSPVDPLNCAHGRFQDSPSFIATGFARKEQLAHWFPQIEDDENKSWRIWLSKRSRALLLHIGVVGAILLVNFALTLWVITHYVYPHGVATIYQGSCALVKRLDLWLHLLINVLSTGMLMASNYCMQLQAAPTRKNIDEAHKAEDQLDIGVPSLRNLSSKFAASSPNGKWNLTAAGQRGLRDPGFSWVINNSSEFGWRIPIMTAEKTIRAMQVNGTSSYKNTSISSCFKIYNDYWAALGNVIIVTNNQSVQGQVDDTLLILHRLCQTRTIGPKINGRQQMPKTFPIDTWHLGPGYYNASYGLVQPPATTVERCRFEYAPGIMLVICTINTVKTCVMFSVWYSRLRDAQKIPIAHRSKEDAVLYTLGDAIASFMQDPDRTTMAMCPATRRDFKRKQDIRLRNRLLPKPITKPREWKRQAVYWNLWNLGFGALSPFTFIHIGLPRDDPAGLISNVLVANLPQFILSVLYLFYNGMISSFLVQREFSKMKSLRKPLRVSEPLGIQRGYYSISLPLRYGIPLYTTSAIMHWLVSQSLFLARITAFFTNGEVDVDSSFSTCGYSPIVLFVTILVGICLILTLLGIGFRKYDAEMPLVASDSRAISAACHVLSEDTECGFMLPVQWGVVKVDDKVGHCAFTTAWDALTKERAHIEAHADRFA
ncbi:hypothetical protein BDR22DRAFT_823401 [Usnea florida]